MTKRTSSIVLFLIGVAMSIIGQFVPLHHSRAVAVADLIWMLIGLILAIIGVVRFIRS